MSGFHDFVEELFAGLGPVRVKKMFGGAGVYAGEVMFALVDDEVIYLKTDKTLQAELETEGSAPWIYAKNPSATHTYWRLPESALDEPEEAARWGRKALSVATAKKTAPKTRTKAKRR